MLTYIIKLVIQSNVETDTDNYAAWHKPTVLSLEPAERYWLFEALTLTEKRGRELKKRKGYSWEKDREKVCVYLGVGEQGPAVTASKDVYAACSLPRYSHRGRAPCCMGGHVMPHVSFESVNGSPRGVAPNESTVSQIMERNCVCVCEWASLSPLLCVRLKQRKKEYVFCVCVSVCVCVI